MNIAVRYEMTPTAIDQLRHRLQLQNDYSVREVSNVTRRREWEQRMERLRDHHRPSPVLITTFLEPDEKRRTRQLARMLKRFYRSSEQRAGK